MGFPYRRSPTLNNPKEKAIKEAVERKEKSIKGFVDAKSASIAVSSAFNGATTICAALISSGRLDGKDFWEKHSEIYKEYLERFANEQIDGAEIYNQITFEKKFPKNDILIKERDGGLDDFANEVEPTITFD